MNMCKFAIRFFCLLLCCACIAFCSSCSESTSSPVTITDLNTPYQSNSLKIEFSDLNVVEATSKDSEKNIKVSTTVIIENLSNNELVLGRFCLQTYVDDVLVDNTISPVNLAPGKRAEVKHDVSVSKEAKKIEYYFYEPLKNGTGDKHVATFAFDIPSVEKVATTT